MLQKGLLFCMAFPALASLAMARLDAELFLWTFYFLPFFAFVLGGLGWLGTRFSRQERLLLYGFGTVYGILSAVLLFGCFGSRIFGMVPIYGGCLCGASVGRSVG